MWSGLSEICGGFPCCHLQADPHISGHFCRAETSPGAQLVQKVTGPALRAPFFHGPHGEKPVASEATLISSQPPSCAMISIA